MKLYKGPWVWSEEWKAWQGPQGSVGCIDLRTLPSQAKTRTVEGEGLFMTDTNLPSPYKLLTSSRSQITSVCRDHLMGNYDITGLTSFKPLMPNKNMLNVHMGGMKHQEDFIKRGRYWNDFKKSKQNDIRDLYNISPSVARKNLGFLELQHGDYKQFLHHDLSGVKPLKPETTINESFDKVDGALGPNHTWTIVNR